MRATVWALERWRRLRRWQQLLLGYCLIVGITWLLWSWNAPDRRGSSRVEMSFVVMPVLIGVGSLFLMLVYRNKDN